MNHTTKIVYCANVFDRERLLLCNILNTRRFFPQVPVYIASNGVKAIAPVLADVHFSYWGANTGWQLGAINGMLKTIQSAVHSEPDIENKNIIFTHDDIVMGDINVIQALLNCLDQADLVVRRYMGPQNRPGWPYYMLECFMMRGAAAKAVFANQPLIEKLPLDRSGIPCCEMMFGYLVRQCKTHEIKIVENTYLKVNEMGFIHYHPHRKTAWAQQAAAG